MLVWLNMNCLLTKGASAAIREVVAHNDASVVEGAMPYDKRAIVRVLVELEATSTEGLLLLEMPNDHDEI